MDDKRQALDVVRFVSMLKHVDDFRGLPFVLQDWQHEVLCDVYGTVRPDGHRQYRFAYLEIPKKNGKSTLIAALLLYHLACDPPDGQIFCCAAEQYQAGLVYRIALKMMEQVPYLTKLLKVKSATHEIINRETGTMVKVLSAEAYSKHGLNPTVVIFDELHAQPNRELWDAMTFGAGSARKQPLWWVITTAGDDPDRKSIAWEQHEYARRVIDGELVDPTWYARIYAAPEDADIYDEAVWARANPSLGATIDIETVRSEALSARNSESSERNFRWLRLNQWIAVKRVGWLPLTLWDSAAGDWTPADLTGMTCYAGLDLSSTTDLTAIALLFPPQPGLKDWRCMFKAFVPMENLRERVRKDKVPYDQWTKHGWLVATDGDAVDYEAVQLAIESYAKQYRLKYVCADKWNTLMLSQMLAKGEKEIKTIKIEQDMAGLSPGMKELERLLRTGAITHDRSPAARWCFGNIRVATDGNENIKPMKNRSVDRIDVIMALIDAMNAAIKLEKKTSVYENRGIRVV